VIEITKPVSGACVFPSSIRRRELHAGSKALAPGLYPPSLLSNRSWDVAVGGLTNARQGNLLTHNVIFRRPGLGLAECVSDHSIDRDRLQSWKLALNWGPQKIHLGAGGRCSFFPIRTAAPILYARFCWTRAQCRLKTSTKGRCAYSLSSCRWLAQPIRLPPNRTRRRAQAP
jgi:hypothetical protein